MRKGAGSGKGGAAAAGGGERWTSLHLLAALAALYLCLVLFFEFPLLSIAISSPPAFSTPSSSSSSSSSSAPPASRSPPSLSALRCSALNSSSHLHRAALHACRLGANLYHRIYHPSSPTSHAPTRQDHPSTAPACPHSITLSGPDFASRARLLLLPCGLTLGSHLTLVARPFPAHPEYDPKITALKDGDPAIMVSQFMLELQGLNAVDGEDPPRILHFNPRLRGDWSAKPVIEMNTCYRMQWAHALRCDGWKSRADEDTGLTISYSYLIYFTYQ